MLHRGTYTSSIFTTQCTQCNLWRPTMLWYTVLKCCDCLEGAGKNWASNEHWDILWWYVTIVWHKLYNLKELITCTCWLGHFFHCFSRHGSKAGICDMKTLNLEKTRSPISSPEGIFTPKMSQKLQQYQLVCQMTLQNMQGKNNNNKVMFEKTFTMIITIEMIIVLFTSSSAIGNLHDGIIWLQLRESFDFFCLLC